MNAQDKDLAAFEEYLFSFMKDSSESTPLTTDEVVAILQNYGPPEESSSEEKEHLVKLMKEAHERRMEVARKMQNPNLIHSVGELFQLFSEWAHIPSAWLARLLNLTEEQFDAHRKDRISPEELGKERILNFAAIAGITIQDLVAIIEKTIKLLKLKPTTNFAAGHARADKEISETTRLNVMDDAMKELMLALDEPGETEQQQDEWQAFRRELFQDYTEDSPPFAENGKCLTILDKSRRNYAQSLLQQI